MNKYLGQFKVVSVREESLRDHQDKLDTPIFARDYWNEKIAPNLDTSKENLVLITLNIRFVPTGWNHISLGSVAETLAYPLDVFRPVLVANAPIFILMHNHPSGDASPSEADRRFTARINEASKLLQLRFADHVIVGDNYFSFREAGLV